MDTSVRIAMFLSSPSQSLSHSGSARTSVHGHTHTCMHTYMPAMYIAMYIQECIYNWTGLNTTYVLQTHTHTCTQFDVFTEGHVCVHVRASAFVQLHLNFPIQSLWSLVVWYGLQY